MYIFRIADIILKKIKKKKKEITVKQFLCCARLVAINQFSLQIPSPAQMKKAVQKYSFQLTVTMIPVMH